MVEREDFEVHLATCAACAVELGQYRRLLGAAEALRDQLEEPPSGLPERVLAQVILEPSRHVDLRRLVHDQRIHVAAASLGGALVGAGAIAVLWWRAARRVIDGAKVPA